LTLADVFQPCERRIIERYQSIVSQIDFLNGFESDERSLTQLVESIVAEVNQVQSRRAVESPSMNPTDLVVAEL
jgi:hypothetical protein